MLVLSCPLAPLRMDGDPEMSDLHPNRGCNLGAEMLHLGMKSSTYSYNSPSSCSVAGCPPPPDALRRGGRPATEQEEEEEEEGR